MYIYILSEFFNYFHENSLYINVKKKNNNNISKSVSIPHVCIGFTEFNLSWF